MDFGLFMSSTDPLHEGVVDSGHFGPPTNPFHEGGMDYGYLKISDQIYQGVGLQSDVRIIIRQAWHARVPAIVSNSVCSTVCAVCIALKLCLKVCSNGPKINEFASPQYCHDTIS